MAHKPRSWLELAGVLALVAGLFFVAYELRQSKAIAMADAAMAAVEGEMSSRSLMVEYADLWHRGCAGEPLEGTELTRFNNIVQANVYPQFIRWMRWRDGMNKAPPGAFSGIIARSVREYPGYRRVFEILNYNPAFKNEVIALASQAEPEGYPAEQCGLPLSHL